MSKLRRCYGESSFGVGLNGFTIGMGGGIIKHNNWGINYFFSINTYRSAGRPADYKPSEYIIFSAPTYPKEHATFLTLALAREFPTADKKLRFALAAGPSCTWRDFKEYEKIQPEYDNLSNYNITTKTKPAPSFTMKAGVTFMRRNKFGVQISLLGNVSSGRSYLGIQYEMLFGKLWTKPKKIKPIKSLEKIRNFRFKESKSDPQNESQLKNN